WGGNFAVSRDNLSRAGVVQGGLPFRGTGASQRFSDRQASFVPQGNSFSRQFASRGGFQRSGAFNSGMRISPGNRDFRGRGFESPRGAGDAGWSRFGGNRGATAPQNGRNSAGFQSAPANRDPGWSRFGGNRGVTATAPFNGGRNSAGFQSPAGNRDSGWSRFGNNRGSSTPVDPGFRGSRFGAYRGGSMA